jgi:hypothetical protein
MQQCGTHVVHLTFCEASHLTMEVRDVHHIIFSAILLTLPLLIYPDAHAETVTMRYSLLQQKVILPCLRKLRIADRLHTGTYAAFLQVLRAQSPPDP